MPTYLFVCEKCEVQWELNQSINEQLPDTCPQCGTTEEQIFHQVYSGDNFCFCRGEPTTFGQQAERNAKRVGKEQIEQMAEQAKASNHKGKRAFKLPSGGTPTTERYRAARPWWRPDSDKPLDVSKLKDPKKFVLEGTTT